MAAAEVSTHTNVCCNVNIRVYKDRFTAASVGHFLQFAVQLLSPVSGLLAETILDGAARTCLSALPSILPDLLHPAQLLELDGFVANLHSLDEDSLGSRRCPCQTTM